MKMKSSVVAGFVALFTIGMSLPLFAQNQRAAAAPKKISAEDKAAIKEIFKGIDPSKYRLEFDGGKDVMGSKKVTMARIKQIEKGGTPDSNNWVILATQDKGVVHIFAVSGSARVLQGVLGKEKLARLQQIEAKYAR